MAGGSIITGASLFFLIYFFCDNAEKETEVLTELVVVEKETVV